MTVGVALLLELFLCMRVPGPGAWLHLGIVFPITAGSLGLLALKPFRSVVWLITPVCFSMVGAGLVSFVLMGGDSAVVFASLALFAIGVPAFGSLSVPAAASITSVTIAAAMVARTTEAGFDGVPELSAVLVGGLIAGTWSGWTSNTAERGDLEAHEELQRLTLTLTHQAQTDTLTGMPNRLHIQEWLEEEWQRSRMDSGDLSLLVVDIDHFKRINDTYGHPVGDSVIQAVALAIQSVLRGQDLAGRWGGEEFVVVLSNCPELAVRRIAERLREAVSELRVPVPGHGEHIHTTVSVGGTTWDGRIPLEPHELVADADAALYEAKGSGRDCVRLRHARGVTPTAGPVCDARRR